LNRWEITANEVNVGILKPFFLPPLVHGRRPPTCYLLSLKPFTTKLFNYALDQKHRIQTSAERGKGKAAPKQVEKSKELKITCARTHFLFETHQRPYKNHFKKVNTPPLLSLE